MNELTRLAMLGTVGGGAELPPGAEHLDALSAELEGRELEWAVLLRAAAEEAYSVAGMVVEQGVALPPAALREQLAPASAAEARLIGALLHVTPAQLAAQGESAGLLVSTDNVQHPERVLAEAVRLLAAKRKRLPHGLLPAAMTTNSSELREALLPVIGERGAWLGTLNPKWAWASVAGMQSGALPADAQTIWETGTPQQRLAVLASLCAADAPRARSWVADVWKVEKAEFRSEMLSILNAQLAPQDEPLLEQALDDRSGIVSGHAVGMLARMPGSALGSRMLERIEPLLELVQPAPRGKLERLVRSIVSGSSHGAVLRVTLPGELPKDWLRDLAARPPAGESRASWALTQTLALIPPRHWEARWKLRPAQLVGLAREVQEEARSVVEGWTRAAVLHQAQDWALALWSFWNDTSRQEVAVRRIREDMLVLLAPLFPRAEAERLFLDNIRTETSNWAAHAFIEALPGPWSVAFANTYLELVRRQLSEAQHNLWLVTARFAAHALPPACFDRALALEPLLERRSTHSYLIAEMLATIKLRKIIYEVNTE